MANSKVEYKEFVVYTIDGPKFYNVPADNDLFSEDVEIQDQAMAVREWLNWEEVTHEAN